MLGPSSSPCPTDSSSSANVYLAMERFFQVGFCCCFIWYSEWLLRGAIEALLGCNLVVTEV